MLGVKSEATPGPEHAREEQPTANTRIAWLDGGQIVHFYVRTLKNADEVHAYHDRVDAVIDSWPVDMPYLALHEAARIIWSPRVRERGERAMRRAQARGLQGRAAVLLRPSPLVSVIRLFVRNGVHQIEIKLFTSRAKALSWLRAAGSG